MKQFLVDHPAELRIVEASTSEEAKALYSLETQRDIKDIKVYSIPLNSYISKLMLSVASKIVTNIEKVECEHRELFLNIANELVNGRKKA